jgi:hypothetical protein
VADLGHNSQTLAGNASNRLFRDLRRENSRKLSRIGCAGTLMLAQDCHAVARIPPSQIERRTKG